MPFPNEHSCRISDPKKYKKFRRVNNAQRIDGKPVDVIFGILAANKSEIQALRFKTSSWKESEARAVCKRRGGILFEPATKPKAEKSWVDERIDEIVDGEFMETDKIEMAKWDRKFINNLPNSSFAAIEPDYLNGKTKDKNARHLPFKDGSGKVDLPHLRNALARVNQIKPVTKSISAEALRSKARKVLDAAAKEHLPSRKNEKSQKMSEELTLTLSHGKPGKFETVKTSEDGTRIMRFELMDNADLYNGVRFTKDALEYQLEQFAKDECLVTHGMDHSGKVLDQLGKVFEMEMEQHGDIHTVFITSEHFNETDAQKQAEILFEQGLLDYISGGWRARIVFNEDTKEFEVFKPMLREVSSTPIPAKINAKRIEEVCASLLGEVVLDAFTEETPMEEIEMTEEPQEPQEHSQLEGDTGQSAELAALKKKVEDLESRDNDRYRNSLLERAAELGLSEQTFENKSNEAIEMALEVAKAVQMSTVREINPDIPIGGEGDSTLQDGSPEMVKYLMDNVYNFDLDGILEEWS